jgi:hypothetical protein
MIEVPQGRGSFDKKKSGNKKTSAKKSAKKAAKKK